MCENCKKLQKELDELQRLIQPTPRTKADIQRQIEEFEEFDEE